MSVYVDALVVWGGADAPPCFRNKASCHLYSHGLLILQMLRERQGTHTPQNPTATGQMSAGGQLALGRAAGGYEPVLIRQPRAEGKVSVQSHPGRGIASRQPAHPQHTESTEFKPVNEEYPC